MITTLKWNFIFLQGSVPGKINYSKECAACPAVNARRKLGQLYLKGSSPHNGLLGLLFIFFTFIYLCFILDFKFFAYNVFHYLAVTGFQNTQMSGSLHLYLFLLPWMLFLLFVCFIPFGCTSFCFTLSYLIIISQNPACFLMWDKKAMCLKLLKITLALVL